MRNKLQQDKTLGLVLSAIMRNGEAIAYVENPTPNLCKLAVEQFGFALQVVPQKLWTSELIEIAVKGYGRALTLIPTKLRTEKLCLLAVQNDGMALKFCKYQTAEMQKIAVAQNPKAARYCIK